MNEREHVRGGRKGGKAKGRERTAEEIDEGHEDIASYANLVVEAPGSRI